VYDLTPFIGNHPDGSNWIKYTQGQEITEQYIVHHLDIKKTDQILQKYYIKDCDNFIPTRYTFEEKGLYQTVKNRMLSKYSIKEL
jgi:cytochrome b involved in lipid metabolism